MKKKKTVEILFFAVLFIFSWWLMWKTFRVNASGNLEIATKVWSDFAATIPLIRSFSFGQNWPPQYPLFAGPPIRYHFAFFAGVGLLEKIGLPLDWALNLPSALSFFLLLLAIYFLSFEIFKKKSVSIMSCLFFLFNGSFAFLDFFKKYPLSIHTLTDIFNHDSFLAFGPYYGNKTISAFWNLNIYTNQRHLALAYAVFLLLILVIYRASQKNNKLSLNKTLLWGIVIGLFPFIHLPVFAMMESALFVFLVIYPRLRKNILVIVILSLIIALPQMIYMGSSNYQGKLFHPGYLIENLNYLSFVKYWFLNLGLVTILAPIGFLLAKKPQRKILLPFLALFVVGNLFQFSPETAANHKFFNLFVIGADIFTAYVLALVWQQKIVGKVLAAICFLGLTLSGIIDLFPIKNDVYAEVKDGKNNPAEQYIIANTAKNSLFLNSSFTYHPASLAGRPIFLGWPYFAWSAGYDISFRSSVMKNIYESHNREEVCRLAIGNKIDYITVENTTNDINLPQIDLSFFRENFKAAYADQRKNFYIIDIQDNCLEYLFCQEPYF